MLIEIEAKRIYFSIDRVKLSVLAIFGDVDFLIVKFVQIKDY